MSRFSAIDLGQLPFPDVVERLDAENIFQQIKADLIARAPELEQVLSLESEPMVKVLQACAYREFLIRARVNDAAKATSLAYAVGADLENLVAFFGIGRLTVTPADLTTVPPTPAVLETDAALRIRAQLAMEGFTTAGTPGSYLFHALSSDARVADAGVTSPAPGEAVVSILSLVGDGVPSAEVIAAVDARLDELRPLTTLLTVQAATLVPYTILAEVTYEEGPSSLVVQAAALAAVQAIITAPRRLGRFISRSEIIAAIHQPGVRNVQLIEPAADIDIAPNEVGDCTSVQINTAPEVSS